MPHHFGPYAIGVEKVLYYMNGVYLKGMEQGQIKPFEPLQLNYEKWNEVNKYVRNELNNEDFQRVNSLIQFIEGYTSDLPLEILATVDYILQQDPKANFNQVMDSISKWNIRKKEFFRREYVQNSFDYLKNYSFETLN